MLSRQPEINNLLNERFFRETVCSNANIIDKSDCDLYHEEKRAELNNLLNGHVPRKKKRKLNKFSSNEKYNYYKISYPSPLNDPFYKALILYFLNLRSTTSGSASAIIVLDPQVFSVS